MPGLSSPRAGKGLSRAKAAGTPRKSISNGKTSEMKKIVVTGGSGRLGQFVIRDLLANGYQVLSLDRVPPREKLCTSWLADLRHSGDLFEAMRESYGVIHLGAYQAPNLAPDAETLSNNVSATYNVLRAAADVGVKKVVIASSTAAFGFIYAKNLWAPEYLPLDEDHPSKPQDSYGLSKVLGEHIADSIVTVHKDMTVSSLRFPGVNFDLSYESFKERWCNPRSRTSGFWTYIDARDAAMTCRLALEAKFTGHEVFIVSATKNCMIQPTMELIKKYLPHGAKIKKVSGTHWSCVDSAKARRMLGFKPQHLWQDYLTEGQVKLG
jgi:nucleoside-diphosphate-sugar epimerase